MLANSSLHTSPLHPLSPLLLPPLHHPSVPRIGHHSFTREEKHFVSGNRCCCSPSRLASFPPGPPSSPSPFCTLSTLPTPASGCPRSICQHVYPQTGEREGREERKEMTDERKQEEQPKASDESALSVKNGSYLLSDDKQEFLFVKKWSPMSGDFNAGKDPTTFVLALANNRRLWTLSPTLKFTFIWWFANLCRRKWFYKELLHKGIFWLSSFHGKMSVSSPIFPEALISRIINPGLCNSIGTLWSLHQRGLTGPEINQQLIAQSGFHPFGKSSIPWQKEGNPSSLNWLIWLDLFLSNSQDNRILPLLSLVIHVEILLPGYLIFDWLFYPTWTLMFPDCSGFPET